MKKPPLRLLALIEARSLTGPAKNLLDFARIARGLGVETHIATFVRGPSANAFTQRLADESIPFHGIPEKGRFDTGTLEHLRRIVSVVQPHIIQTHAVKSHFLTHLSGVPKTLSWIAFHHGYTATSWMTLAYNKLDRWSLPRADKTLTVSQAFAQDLVNRQGVSPDRIEVVHNAIRADWGQSVEVRAQTAELRESLGIPQGRRILLNVGRLSREKDPVLLVEAFARIRNLASVHLVIVGEGPERRAVEQTAARLKVTDRVTLAGQQVSAERYYAISDIAIISSRSEGSPNALLESMAAGVPVVSTAVGGIPEIATDRENAMLVKSGDAEGLAAAVDSLLDNPDFGRTLARNGQTLVQSRFTPAARVNRLLQIYCNVLDASDKLC